MKAGGIYGAHNIVEAYNGNNWIVLDPTFNLAFVRPDSRLACFADVQNNLPYYSKQVPEGYNLQDHYKDFRYNNLTKLQFLFPAVKRILNLTIVTKLAKCLS